MTSSLVKSADDLYRGQAGLRIQLQRLRPQICPFDRLIAALPTGSRVLDVGCGAGLFLGLAAGSDRSLTGVGFDVNADAVAAAQVMAQRSGLDRRLEFQRRDIAQGWPEGAFDVIAMIDVMHHIPAAAQREVFDLASERLGPGGIFLYKDIASDDRLRSLANSVHDLMVSRELPRYLPREAARAHAITAGFEELRYERLNILWYGHDLHVFGKRR